jgi:hypothetical protein
VDSTHACPKKEKTMIKIKEVKDQKKMEKLMRDPYRLPQPNGYFTLLLVILAIVTGLYFFGSGIGERWEASAKASSCQASIPACVTRICLGNGEPCVDMDGALAVEQQCKAEAMQKYGLTDPDSCMSYRETEMSLGFY